MDKFIVVKIWEHGDPTLVETLDNPADASAYANIMRRKDTKHQYAVYQLNEEL